MFFDTHATKLARKDGGSIANRFKEMMAFVIFPAGRQAPAREELARLTSSANKYCTRVVELLEASVSLLGAKSIAGGNAGSGSARPKVVREGLESGKPNELTSQVPGAPFSDIFGLIE